MSATARKRGLGGMARMVEQVGQTASRPVRAALRGLNQNRLDTGDRLRVLEDAVESADTSRAELGAGARLELAESGLARERGPVDPRRDHRVERIGDVDDPR